MNIKTKLLTAIVLVVSTSSHAELVSRLGGLAYYDTDADLTWLTDASSIKTAHTNSGGTIGDANGRTSWAIANDWVTNLNVAGVTGWRLPSSVDLGDNGCDYSFSGTDCGYNIDLTTGELANLFESVLGRASSKDTNGDWIVLPFEQVSPTLGPFINISPGYYWSNTPEATNNNHVFVYSTSTGDQIVADKTGSNLRTWAVQSGDVEAVPVPAAAWLFASGLLGLVSVFKRKRA